MRILVVEDEPAAAAVLSKGLREHAYAVDVAADGLTALEQASISDYDLIVLDVLMPGVNGLEVCRRLRAEGIAAPILMLTARGEPDDRVEGLDVGADDYLPKPYHFPELLARIRALLRRGPAFASLVIEIEGLTIVTQRQFMADAAHELRTPVATTRTAANVALQQPQREELEYRDTLTIIEQQATRLSRIVDDMFTLARADAGIYPVRQMPMYLDEVVDDVVRAARVLASTRNVSIEAATIPSAALTGDEDLIRRLMVNLLDNAIRYTPAGSTVRVDLEQASGGYALSISDHGPGIPADVQPHIFERFYRADAARTRRDGADGGAGLGLALARWIAEAHGGHLTLAQSSEAGTTFTAFLRNPS